MFSVSVIKSEELKTDIPFVLYLTSSSPFRLPGIKTANISYSEKYPVAEESKHFKINTVDFILHNQNEQYISVIQFLIDQEKAINEKLFLNGIVENVSNGKIIGNYKLERFANQKNSITVSTLIEDVSSIKEGDVYRLKMYVYSDEQYTKLVETLVQEAIVPFVGENNYFKVYVNKVIDILPALKNSPLSKEAEIYIGFTVEGCFANISRISSDSYEVEVGGFLSKERVMFYSQSEDELIGNRYHEATEKGEITVISLPSVIGKKEGKASLQFIGKNCKSMVFYLWQNDVRP